MLDRSRKVSGPTPKLRDRQTRQILRLINGKDPRQYGFDFGLWACQILQALIDEKFGITIEVQTSGQRQLVNARGEFWFKVFTRRFNKELFTQFLKS